jgi:hypothetical protein
VEYFKDKEAKAVEQYMAAHKLPVSTVADTATITGVAPTGDTSIPTEN